MLLLDEPLNAVDEVTRDRLISLLKDVRDRSETTVLHVTHNREEAELLGGVVLRVEDGRVVTGDI